ncbi:MAG TPA: 3,4-dihydroxy-2-butanone-4-phosphate synthase [Gammaproteobacteria bacterium]|nr:3,4-dihydroxy-2-butanone-4-phosphate synthase [Gammaproteobacteria bacterium]
MQTKIQTAIAALKQGKMILLTDHQHRENEGDLIYPAETITPEAINFMIKNGTGIICISMLPEQLQRLDLPLMVPPENNHTQHGTPFTIPVDARHGITTGVSAADRAKTITTLMNAQSQPHDLVRPGHVYPLKARAGGVIERAGHTEGAIDIVRLAGFKPAGVLCEVMNPDGTMARGQKLAAFAEQHQIPILSIDDLIQYRLTHENQIKETASTEILLNPYGEFTLTVLQEKYFPHQHITLFKPAIDPTQSLLVRIHSSCATGDIFHSAQCDCYDQLHYSLRKISESGGLLIYLDQEGRGIGLLNKIKAYALQKTGLDTVEANQQLGLPVDQRQYYIPAHILRKLSIPAIRLLTNNPQKISGLAEFGYTAVTQEAMPSFLQASNRNYLLTKRQKLAHTICL